MVKNRLEFIFSRGDGLVIPAVNPAVQRHQVGSEQADSSPPRRSPTQLPARPDVEQSTAGVLEGRDSHALAACRT